MMNLNNFTPVSGLLPDDYEEILSWKVTGKPIRGIALNILGVFLFVIFGVIFSSLAVRVGKFPPGGEFRSGLSEIGSVLAGILLPFVLREHLHSLTMRMFGARPRYGIIWKGVMLYATSPGYAYRRNHHVIIALAPLVFIGILVVLGMWLLQGTLWVVLLGICGIVNASGAIGDMRTTIIMLRYINTAYVMDERDGICAFLPNLEARRDGE